MLQLNIEQAADLIAATGHKNTVLLQGEPGIGKSAVLGMLKKRFPEYDVVYFDCATKDLGDIFLPRFETENGTSVVKFSPNADFMVHTGRPAIICFDELGKAMRPVQNALLSALHERRMGGTYFHEKTIVFATTNAASDGVGDLIQAHALGRMCVVHMAKPNAKLWIRWAQDADVSPELLTFVKQTPRCLASYFDGDQKENPYIYHPTKAQTAYVTPRSLFKADAVVKARNTLGPEVTMAGVAGLLGESAARDMVALFGVADELPTRESIIADPEGADLPQQGAAIIFLTFSLLQMVTTETIDKIMIYVMRMPKESQAVFVSQALDNDKISTIAIRNKMFKQWCIDNKRFF